MKQELYKKSRKKNKRSVSDQNDFYKNLFFEALETIRLQKQSFEIELKKQQELFSNVEEEMQLLIHDLDQLNKKYENKIKLIEYNFEETEWTFEKLERDHNRLHKLHDLCANGYVHDIPRYHDRVII